MIKGTGWIGSEKLETSVANENIIKPTVEGYEPCKLYSISFINNQDCTIIINDKYKLFLQADQGFMSTHIDTRIESFRIEEDGIEYNWHGAY